MISLTRSFPKAPFAARALLCFALWAVPAALHADSLGDTLDHILSSPALKGGITGAVVQRVGDGQIVYARNAETRLTPASNRKLFTSAAALELLGASYVFTTQALAAEKPDAAGTLHGDIYLRGAGDSLLAPEDLEAIANAVAGAGVKRIEGRVIGDGSFFRDGPYGYGWEWDDLPYYYAPQISGLEVSRGVLAVHVTAGSASGALAHVSVDPPTRYLRFVSTATTGARNSAPDSCRIVRLRGQNVLEISGTVPLGGEADETVTVEDPACYAAAVLNEALQRVGVQVTGVASTGKTPPNARLVLGSHTSIPMTDYIARMNKPSDNLLAESLVRVVGAVKGKAGTYAGGHAAEMTFFGKLGLDTTQIDLFDGSGLAREDEVTPSAVAGLLRAMHAQANWPAYEVSLPIAGIDGSLRNRMKGTAAAGNIHAKTGSLHGVSSLSGYLTGTHGDLYAFSLIMNNFPGTEAAARGVQDQFAEALVSSL